MKTDLSLIITTRRWDGLDVTLNHAKRQKFNGIWELVLVDKFRDERHTQIEMWSKEHSINLLHICPKIKKDINGNPLPRTNLDYGNAYNTGFLYANSEIVVSTDDFMGFKPDFIQNHYDFLKKSGEEFCCLGPIYSIDYIPFEKRHDDITTFGCDRFVPRDNTNTNRGNTHNGFHITSEMNYRQSNVATYLKNYIKINGYDERFDAGGFFDEKRMPDRAMGMCDNDMPYRLYDAGIYFHMEDSVPTWHMNHTEDSHFERYTEETDPDYWKKLCNLPVHFNLAEERQLLHTNRIVFGD